MILRVSPDELDMQFQIIDAVIMETPPVLWGQSSDGLVHSPDCIFPNPRTEPPAARIFSINLIYRVPIIQEDVVVVTSSITIRELLFSIHRFAVIAATELILPCEHGHYIRHGGVRQRTEFKTRYQC